MTGNNDEESLIVMLTKSGNITQGTATIETFQDAFFQNDPTDITDASSSDDNGRQFIVQRDRQPSNQESESITEGGAANAITSVYEIQATNANDKYASFFIDSNVVSNGMINVATQIDPLFFILPRIQKAASKWAPLDQICAALSLPYKLFDDNYQQQQMVGHLCVKTDELGDDIM